MVWTLATGVFILGMGGLALSYLVDDTIDETRVFVAIVFLAANGLFGGLLTMMIASRYVAERLERLASAQERVEHGELEPGSRSMTAASSAGFRPASTA